MPPEKVGGYLRDLRHLFEKYGYRCALYGHFGQGCIHTRIDFDLKTAEGIQKYKSFIHEAAYLVTGYGGSTFDIYNPPILASNGLIHDQMASILA